MSNSIQTPALLNPVTLVKQNRALELIYAGPPFSSHLPVLQWNYSIMRYFESHCKVKCVDTKQRAVQLKLDSSDGQELQLHTEVVFIPVDVASAWQWCIFGTAFYLVANGCCERPYSSVFKEDSTHRYSNTQFIAVDCRFFFNEPSPSTCLYYLWLAGDFLHFPKCVYPRFKIVTTERSVIRHWGKIWSYSSRTLSMPPFLFIQELLLINLHSVIVH